MFNSQMLDAAIGLVLVYFLLSLLCSVIAEIFTALTKKRARMLSDGILSLINQDQNALNNLYRQHLFIGNSPPQNVLQGLVDSIRPGKKKRFPSYISSRSFVLSLLESLKQHPDVIRTVIQNTRSRDQERIAYCMSKVQSLPENHPEKAKLLKSLTDAEHDLTKVPSAIKQCCDEIVKNPDVLKNTLEELKDHIPTLSTLSDIKTLVSSLDDDNAIKKCLGSA